MNLLIVEDDLAYGQTLCRRMRKQGFTVELVTDATDVLVAARRIVPEYIVMDMKLNIGLIMPKVLNPAGTMQMLCKFIPNPIDLLASYFLKILFLK